MMDNIDFKQRMEELETQLALSQDKLQVRENVIAQLEEEIQGKKVLIFEQNHLISILESEAASQQQHLQAMKCDNNNKYDTESLASESEITVIEREIVASSSSTSPCSSEKSMPTSSSSEMYRSGECMKSCRCQNKYEQLQVRENVIAQLEEEIQGKKVLIFEQNHLISILESEAASQQQHLQAMKCDNNNKYDTESLASESEITVIEREIVASSSSTSPCSSEKSMPTSSSSEMYRSGECMKSCRCQNKYEQAMVDRERLELQNEQLLKQWEEALEYVSSVQRQLQEEINRNSSLKYQMTQREKDDVVVIPRTVMNLVSFIILVFGLFLYRL